MPAESDYRAPTDDNSLSSPIRRGRGLRLSTHGTPAEGANTPPAPPESSLRRGQGLTLSVQHSTASPITPDVSRATTPSLPERSVESVHERKLPLHRLHLTDCEIAYRQRGDGPPLLLIHGWAGSSRYWLDTLAELSAVRTGYAPDLPGFGDSPPLAAPARVVRQAEHIIAFADALGLAQFDVNGHSFGAGVAVYIAAHWPSRVRRLILTSFGVQRTPSERLIAGLMQQSMDTALHFWQPWLNAATPWLRWWQPYTSTLMRTPPVPQAFAAWFLEQRPSSPRLMREGIDEMMRMDLRAHLACVASVGDPATIAALRAIQAPTLLVTGACDRMMPLSSVESAQALIPNSRLMVLPECGHVPMIERPVLYHQTVRDFLIDK